MPQTVPCRAGFDDESRMCRGSMKWWWWWQSHASSSYGRQVQAEVHGDLFNLRSNRNRSFLELEAIFGAKESVKESLKKERVLSVGARD